MTPTPALNRSDVQDAPVEVLEEIFEELKDKSGSLEIITDLLSELESNEPAEVTPN
jgi:hypothetical protein